MSTLTFKEHMDSRKDMYSNCKKVTIGSDFAVFEFEDLEDVEKALRFSESCNNLYHYTFDSNLVDKIVCFNSVK